MECSGDSQIDFQAENDARTLRAEVYVAEDENLQRRVTLKLLLCVLTRESLHPTQGFDASFT